MFNMDKITRTKLAMLVTLVLLNIFTTLGLVYTMAVSKISSVGGNDSVELNVVMLFAIVIAFMWVVALILFHEFKTDDLMRTHMIKMEGEIADLKEFKDILKETVYTPVAINPDVLKDGGIQGHSVPSK